MRTVYDAPVAGKLTKAVQDKVVGHILMGCYGHVAARAAGIGYTTYQRWLQKGRAELRMDELEALTIAELREIASEEGIRVSGQRKRTIAAAIYKQKSRYRHFADAVEEAQAEVEAAAAACLRRAWDEDWRSCVEYLKRVHPDRWGQKDAILMRGQIEHVHATAGLDNQSPPTLAALGLDADAVEAIGRSLSQQLSQKLLPAPIDVIPPGEQSVEDPTEERP